MKILVDKMPTWYDCPFAQPVFTYLDGNENERRCRDIICKFDNTPCNLYQEKDECKLFKQLNIKVIAQ